ncbi:MAG: hypothetical protein KAY24_02205 [Candidatus Eisenbacteria sp.]|nr:hypothetical protein [Candidatus Eisenbacteria bacterium]
MKPHLWSGGVALFLALGILGCSESLAPQNPGTPHEGAPLAMWVSTPSTVPFLAGQTIDVGEVTVSNDEQSLCVEIGTTGGWVMTETHVAIALSVEELPQTGSGNPKIGQFALAADHDPPVASYDHCISLVAYQPGDMLFIAVHAAVELLDAGGAVLQEETAWAQGPEFPGQSWAMYFNYVVQECGGGGE